MVDTNLIVSQIFCATLDSLVRDGLIAREEVLERFRKSHAEAMKRYGNNPAHLEGLVKAGESCLSILKGEWER